MITGSRPDLKSGAFVRMLRVRVPRFPYFGELAQWLVQRTVNPPIQVRFLYSPYYSVVNLCYKNNAT